MAGTTLDQPSLGTSIFGNLLGTNNSSYSTAANNVFSVGQYQPYTVNNPMGQTSFANGAANSSLSPLQSQLQSQFGSQIGANAGASSTYNPNTSFLPQQYQSIFGNMQGNTNSMFNSLQAAQQPFTQQYLQSNLDNEQSKGTLASTAGSYQTAGAQTAANSQMNSNMAQAQTYALNQANSQFGAASSTAGLGEQQAEFGPQYAQSQTQGDFSDLLNQNQLSAQITGLGGSLGAQQSSANTAAAMPSYNASTLQAGAQNSLTNGLLFGSGGLLTSLLGSGSGSSSGLGGLISSLFGGSGAVSGSAAQTGSLGDNAAYDNYFGGSGASNNAQGSIDSDLNSQIGSMGEPDYDLSSFSSAGGQAADSSEPLMEVQSGGLDSLNEGSALSSFGLNDIGAGAGIVGDLASGTSTGYAKGALSGAQLGAQTGLFGSGSGLANSTASSGLSALGLYQGIQQGGVAGGLEAGASAAKLASTAGSATGLLSSGAAGALSAAAGAIGAGVSLYNEAESWQSGNTGSDALGGAESGASIGATVGSIVPGIGTAIGAVAGAIIGGIGGAVSSAFGGGKIDPETTGMYAANAAGNTSLSAASPAASFGYLTGVMDGKNPTPGHSTVLEQTFGRQGEGSVLNGMAGAINTALQKGTITNQTSATNLFSSVIQPWLTSKGVSASSLTFKDAQGNSSGQNLQNALTNLGSSYLTGSLTSSTKLDSGGDTDKTLPTLFSGLTS